MRYLLLLIILASTAFGQNNPPSGGGGLGNVTLSGTPTTGQVPTATSSTTATWQTGPVSGSVSHSIPFTFVNGGSALSGTTVGCKLIPSTGTIANVTTTGDVSGSATVGVKTVAYASYTGTAGYSGYTDIVNGGTAPSLSSAVKYTDSTLTSWLTSLTGGQYLCVQMSSPSTVTNLNVIIVYTGTT